MRAPKPTAEQYSLFRAYLDARHPDGGMADMSVLDYSMMVEDSHIDTVITEYRRRGPDTAIHGRGEGPLIAACLTDRLADGLSLVYSFYDPAEVASARSAPMSSSTISKRRGASACRMSISAIGSRARARWPIRAPIFRRSGWA